MPVFLVKRGAQIVALAEGDNDATLKQALGPKATVEALTLGLFPDGERDIKKIKDKLDALESK